MPLDGFLHIVAVVFTFSLRIGIVWLFCAALTQLLHRPNHRFLIWFSFSLGSVLYWFVSLYVGFRHNTPPQAHFLNLPWSHVLVPAGWASIVAGVGVFLVVEYLVVVVLLLARGTWNRRRLRKILSLGSPASAPFNAALELLCRELKVKKCRLVVLPEISSPAIVYWRNPRLLVPEICHRLESLSEFTHIMRHELVHVVRRDYLISAVADMITTLLCFHPAVWAARARMRMERELACDLAVVEAIPESRADYAGSLTNLMRLNLTNEGRSPGVGFSAPASLLGRRIRSILLIPQASSHMRQCCFGGAATAILAVLILFAPWFSMAIDIGQDEQLQFAALWSPIRMQSMKRHVRSTLVVPVRTKPAAQGLYRVPSHL